MCVFDLVFLNHLIAFCFSFYAVSLSISKPSIIFMIFQGFLLYFQKPVLLFSVMIKTYSGFIAIVGPTNAGKSTLLNQIMARKVSIVSHKVQTTRTRLRAIKMVGNKQLIFVDTPGVFKPSRRLDRAMVDAAMSAIEDADAVLLVLDAQKGITQTVRDLIEKIKQHKNLFVALNKVDAIAKSTLLPMVAELTNMANFNEIFMISALKNGRNVTLLSPRRMGKTGLIMRVFDEIKKRDKNSACFYVDIFPTRSLDEFVALLGKSVLGALDGLGKKMLNAAVSTFKSCKLSVSVDPVSGSPQPALDFQPKETKNTLAEIFEYLKNSDKECFVAIDEFQQITYYKDKKVEELLRGKILSRLCYVRMSSSARMFILFFRVASII